MLENQSEILEGLGFLDAIVQVEQRRPGPAQLVPKRKGVQGRTVLLRGGRAVGRILLRQLSRFRFRLGHG